MTLKELIDTLVLQRKININIHDVSGVLESELLNLPFSYCIHNCTFCKKVKSSDNGYIKCTTHKNRITHFVIKSKKILTGRCPYGISEIVYPVVKDNRVLCIIYIGNICLNADESEKYIESAQTHTKAEITEIKQLLGNCEQVEPTLHIKTAEIIADFILRHIGENQNDFLHYAVKFTNMYAQKYYMHDLHLSHISDLCRINEKYLGRLFKEQIGVSFRQYLTNIRLKKAAELITQTSKSITEICYFCGFNEITYFNHLFKKEYSVSPSDYRKKYLN